jgi:hypothetical protein
VNVEPWLTPFLVFVHQLCFSPARRLSKKLDALATMIEQERVTYEAWLSQPNEILPLLEKYFVPKLSVKRWGKLIFVGVVR